VHISPENNISAAPAIAAVGAAFRHEFLAPKTDTTAPAVTGLGKYFDPIDKHRGTLDR
jgi:hypothetical protein